jgi:hypothetical protein
VFCQNGHLDILLGGALAPIDDSENRFEDIPKLSATNATMGYKDKENVRGYEDSFVVRFIKSYG